MKKAAFILLSILILISLLSGCSGSGQEKMPTPTGGSVQSKDTPVTMDDISKMKVAVLLGSVYDTYMAKNYPETEVLQYKSNPDLILAVKTGKADAGLIVTETMKEMQRTDSSLKILVDHILSNPIGMGFNKDNNELREQFNSFLNEIKSNGVYDNWVKRWFVDGNTEMPVIENKKNNGTLMVGTTSDKGMPFAIVKDNQLIGSDTELAERFGA
ncbi:MAG: transporter substrate-binding domain-containing protein, partial [Eubacteriales bacterium]